MVPSILNCDSKERRKRYRAALRREYLMLITEPIKKALPEAVDGLLALITCALGFIAMATILLMIV